jgi:hypothetical protein
MKSKIPITPRLARFGSLALAVVFYLLALAPVPAQAANLIDEILGSARKFTVFHGADDGNTYTFGISNEAVVGNLGIGPGSQTKFCRRGRGHNG